ncbi:TetR family transcriptional regulator [Streptomyces avermitilis]|uniref:TetR family transcriptional regulator n=1 Tax=Streptomyces avermitilis TaxID=33903 RepID=UPI00381B5C03
MVKQVRQERAIRTRNALIESAAALFARHGYEVVSLSTISARAGVSNGALHFHFPSKAALAEAVGVAAAQRFGRIIAGEELPAQRGGVPERGVVPERGGLPRTEGAPAYGVSSRYEGAPERGALPRRVEAPRRWDVPRRDEAASKQGAASRQNSALQTLIDTSHALLRGLGHDAVLRAGFALGDGAGAVGRGEDLYRSWQEWVAEVLARAEREGLLARGLAVRDAVTAVVGATIGFAVLGGHEGQWLSRTTLTRFWTLLLPRLATPTALEGLMASGRPPETR